MSQSLNKSSQAGIALIVVLIVLTVMMAATISMVRNAGVGMGIVGNLGFKQNATSVGDLGVEAASAWVQANAGILDVNAANNWYRANGLVDPANFDPLTYDWAAANNSVIAPNPVNLGNTVRYVIHRMCQTIGDSTSTPAIPCVRAATAPMMSHSSGSGGIGAGGPGPAFFRITVRVDGPRNTLSYTQVMIY